MAVLVCRCADRRAAWGRSLLHRSTAIPCPRYCPGGFQPGTSLAGGDGPPAVLLPGTRNTQTERNRLVRHGDGNSRRDYRGYHDRGASQRDIVVEPACGGGLELLCRR